MLRVPCLFQGQHSNVRQLLHYQAHHLSNCQTRACDKRLTLASRSQHFPRNDWVLAAREAANRRSVDVHRFLQSDQLNPTGLQYSGIYPRNWKSLWHLKPQLIHLYFAVCQLLHAFVFEICGLRWTTSKQLVRIWKNSEITSDGQSSHNRWLGILQQRV